MCTQVATLKAIRPGIDVNRTSGLPAGTTPFDSILAGCKLFSHPPTFMDRWRGKRAETQPVSEAFQPSFQWAEDPLKHVLQMKLPGFKREELRVSVDNSGRLQVQGKRRANENKTVVVDQAFELPADAGPDAITGRFDGECLTVIMPKVHAKGRVAEKAIPPDEANREIQEKESTEPSREASERSTKKAIMPSSPPPEFKGNGEQEASDKMAQHGTDKTKKMQMSEKHESLDEEEPFRKEKMASKKEAITPSLPPPSPPPPSEWKGDRKREALKKMAQPSTNKEAEETEMSDKHGAIEEVEPLTREKMKNQDGDRDSRMTEAMLARVGFGKRKYECGWPDTGLMDGLLEKINKNKNVIVVAAVAFSVGFYVSCKNGQFILLLFHGTKQPAFICTLGHSQVSEYISQ